MSGDDDIHDGPSFGPSLSGSLEEGTSSSLTLRDNFLEELELRAQYSDQDFQEISTRLQSRKLVAWSAVPRLYIVLRKIGQLQSLDHIISHGISDYWFPFTAKSVQATTLSSPIQNEFLEAQKLVLTKAVDLEKDGEKKHFHFSRGDTIPFKGLGELGRGGYATVDKVSSLFSRRQYARKLFKRQNGGNRTAVQSFMTELRALKKIHHRHCVELIASYTDSKYFGIIMSPIADCNLNKFYISVSVEPEKLIILRTFFGCLISALEYLHNEKKIRHRDIKPENILVKGSDVYLTDFGISLDWEHLSRGTTTADSGKTRLYCAPEVANHQQRNSSSDIWSLGCVFLEMCTVLKGRTIDEMQLSFKRRSGTHAFYANLPAIQDWSNNLQKCGSELDDLPLEWAASMLQLDRNSRPLAQNLHKTISKCRSTSDRDTRTFCADCCVVEDEESTGGSASDGELWAEDMDDNTTSPALTNEIAKAAGPKSSVQEDLPGNGDSSVYLDSMKSLPYSVTVHQAPPFSVDRPDTDQGSSTSQQNIAYSHIPSESPVHSLPNTYLPVSRYYFGASPDVSKIPLAKAHSLVESALSENSDTVSPIQANLQPARCEMQPFATFPEPEIGKELEGGTSDELPPSEPPEPDINRQLEQGAIRQIQTAQEDLVNINESRRKYVFVKTPKLTSPDWENPSALLKALEKDEQVMEYLIYNVPEIQTFPKEDPRYITRIVQLLIENGLDVNNGAYQDDAGRPLILRVIYWSKGDHYKSLFSSMIKGANLGIRITGRYNRNGSLFELVARAGRVWAVAALIAHDGAKPDGWISDLQKGAFNDWNSDGEVLQFLIDTGMINADYNEAETEAHYKAACTCGSSGLVKFLLDAYPNKFNPKKGTGYLPPLHLACQWGNLEVARLLLARGASPNISIPWSTWALGRCYATPLFMASEAGHAHVVKYLLELERGLIDANLRDQGTFALHIACLSGHVEVARELLIHGADPSQKIGVRSCLQLVAEQGHTELTKLFLDHGGYATPLKGWRSTLGLTGSTPLALAQRNGHIEVAALLIRAKAENKIKEAREGKKKESAQDTNGKDKLALDTKEKDQSA